MKCRRAASDLIPGVQGVGHSGSKVPHNGHYRPRTRSPLLDGPLIRVIPFEHRRGQSIVSAEQIALLWVPFRTRRRLQ